jgi:hypothetical protein
VGAIEVRGLRRIAAVALVTALAVLGSSGAVASATASVELYAEASGGATSGSCQYPAPSCTLGWALTQAESPGLTGDDVEVVLAPGTYSDAAYTINSGYAAGLIINGSLGGVIIDGSGSGVPFTVEVPYEVSIEYLTIEGGSGSSAADVLADNTGSFIALADVTVNGGNASAGALIAVTGGELDVSETTVENAASGTPGIKASGTSTLYVGFSTVDDVAHDPAVEYAGASGGWIKETTLAHDSFGTLDDSTGALAVDFSTYLDNGDGLSTANGTSENLTTLADAISNTTGSACLLSASHPTDDGYDIADDHSCDFVGTGSVEGAASSAIGLGPLRANGGPEDTSAIGPASDAYDIVPLAMCEDQDERLQLRAQPGARDCDAGAYQYAPPTLTGLLPLPIAAGAVDDVEAFGSNLNGVTSASVDGSPTTFQPTISPQEINNMSLPALSAGTHTLTVSGPDGSASLQFTVSTGTPPSPPMPVLSLSAPALRRHSISVEASCATETCTGQLTLTRTIKVRTGHGRHSHTHLETVTLARGSYSLSAGTSAREPLKPAKGWRSVYGRASHRHPLRLLLTASVTGGADATLAATRS